MPELRRLQAYAAFLVCAGIWGSTFLFISIGNDTVPPLWGAALRLLLAGIVLAALVAILRQPLPRGAALRAAIQYGFFQFGLNFPLLYWGEKSVPSGLAAVLFATIPLLAAVYTHLLGMERIDPRKVGGALVGLAGVAVIFAQQLAGEASLLPILAVLGAAATAALGTTLLKRGPRQHPIGANAVGVWVGLPMCLAASWLAGEPHGIPRGFGSWFPILYLAIAGSVVAFVLLAWLVNHWKVTSISFIALIVPVIALLLGILIRGERLTATGLVGSALVLAGVTLGVMAEAAGAARPAAVSSAPPTPRA
jgi:drug/metabolite transporter (DMT)-like permease